MRKTTQELREENAKLRKWLASNNKARMEQAEALGIAQKLIEMVPRGERWNGPFMSLIPGYRVCFNMEYTEFNKARINTVISDMSTCQTVFDDSSYGCIFLPGAWCDLVQEVYDKHLEKANRAIEAEGKRLGFELPVEECVNP